MVFGLDPDLPTGRLLQVQSFACPTTCPLTDQSPDLSSRRVGQVNILAVSCQVMYMGGLGGPAVTGVNCKSGA